MEENKEKKDNNKFTFAKPSKIEPKGKKGPGFGKSVVLPFCSGIIGAALVVGACFGIPSIKSSILGGSISSSSGSQSVGTRELSIFKQLF